MNEPYLNITPLGGLGEIGLNCQLWETSGGVVMVDCGLMFPDDAHLGVDVVIPHFGAVSGIKDKLLGIVLTHGHEDHIGALPWIVPEIKGTRIYGLRALPWRLWNTSSGSGRFWIGWSCALSISTPCCLWAT